MKHLYYISETAFTAKVRDDDFYIMRDLAGGRYRISSLQEGGYGHRIGLYKSRWPLIAGALVFLLIMIYQSLFISEIEVSGYKKITEESLRTTMKEAGFYEGCRKNVNIDKVKLHVYDEFDNISWIGIKYKGNMAQVTIAETDALYKNHQVKKHKPCNIVAEKSGYINSIDPEQGLRAAEDGQYVKEGDVIISGVIPLAKTTYEEGSEDETETYVHAEGYADAKIPVRLNFYRTNGDVVINKSGQKMITLSVNDRELLGTICPYEMSALKRITLCNWVKPVKVKIQVNIISKCTLQQRKITDKELKNQVITEINKFVKEKLPDNAQILNKSLNFTWEKNIIRIGVTLETLQQIGIEEEIIVDKSNRKTDQDEHQ